MIVVDVETTGTNPQKHSILSIGAIDFNDPSRQFYEECRIWNGAHMDDEAFAVNGFNQEQATDPLKQPESSLVEKFLEWSRLGIERTVGGQNPFFDVNFIQAAAGRAHANFDLGHRTFDLHTICYFHMTKRGIVPPMRNNRTDIKSDLITQYVGIPSELKPHIAINGAKWEAEAFSRFLYDKPLFDEYKQYPIPWLGK